VLESEFILGGDVGPAVFSCRGKRKRQQSEREVHLKMLSLGRMLEKEPPIKKSREKRKKKRKVDCSSGEKKNSRLREKKGVPFTPVDGEERTNLRSEERVPRA